MILYTVQGRRPDPGHTSVADATGLSDFLGYEPLFCSRISPDSLADTWFRLFCASPSQADVIHVLEVDDSQAQAMDVVTWCATCFDAERRPVRADEAALAAALDCPSPEFADYVVPRDVAAASHRRYDVRALLRGDASGLGLSREEAEALAMAAQRVRELVTSPDAHLSSSFGTQIASPSLGEWYRLLMLGGVVPFLWAQATGRRVCPDLVRMDPRDLAQTRGFARAQEGVARWDRSLGTLGSFGHADFLRMRAAFVEGCDQLAHTMVTRRAARLGLRRNDACLCGSGRKYKSCCMTNGLDAIARLW